MIKPTIGRVVWFHPAGEQIGDQPLPALVCYVHGDRLINISAFDRNGCHTPVQEVRLVQEGETLPSQGENYCTWMPYQVGQAKKEGEESSRRPQLLPGGDSVQPPTKVASHKDITEVKGQTNLANALSGLAPGQAKDGASEKK